MALQFNDARISHRLSSTLLKCSQVCRLWYIRSLNNLYRSIRIEKFKSHGMTLPTTVRNHPGVVNYTRAWTLCEPSSTYNITGTMLKVLPTSKTRILHLIGCQKFIEHPMFFKLIPVMNSQVKFLSLQRIALYTRQFFRLLASTPNLQFLVVSHDLIKQSKQNFISGRQPQCRLKGLIIKTDNESEDGEKLFGALLRYPEFLSVLETLLITFHPNWIMGEEMEAVTSIVEGAMSTLKHVGFTFKDSSYEDVKQAGMCILFLAGTELIYLFSRYSR